MDMTGNIFLVGLMGAGKTTVGRLLAKHLDKTFLDVDHELEARTGVSIPVIFELEGEDGFRAREVTLIDELVRRDNIVLATGGGAVLRAENRATLAEHGVVVYLSASVDDLWHRTRHDRNRPLLQTQDPKAKLAELLVQRDPLYREIADIVVTSGHHSVNHVVREIEQKIADLGKQAAHGDCRICKH
jgi:shikimate kinase